VWLNGEADLRLATHELGHNLGLGHSGSESCTDPFGRRAPLDVTCTDDEYGDRYSAMGNTLSGSYSPLQLARLGWNDGQVTTVTEGGTLPPNVAHHVLTASEANAAGTTTALRVVDGPYTFWLEYRLPYLINGPTPTGFNGGLLLRVERTGRPPTPGAPFLMFMNDRQGEGINETPQPQLNVGQEWANPLGRLHVRLGSTNANRANVTIRWATTLITMPDVLFNPASTSISLIESTGFTLGPVGTEIDKVCDDVGKIIRQIPAAGTVLPARSRVDVVVAVADPASNCAEPPVIE
jgi:hypothetical protein